MAQPLAPRPEPDREPPRPGPRPLTARRGTPRLLARFDDRTRAREAMLALESAGIDGADIGLIGPNATRAARRARRRRPDAADSQITRWVAGRSLGMSVRIGLIGAAAGLVVGLVIGAITGSWVFAPVVAVIVGVFAAVVGAMVGAERSAGLNDTWELTFHEGPRDSVWVALYGGDVGRASEILRRQGSADLRRPADLDALGKLFEGVDTGRRTV